MGQPSIGMKYLAFKISLIRNCQLGESICNVEEFI